MDKIDSLTLLEYFRKRQRTCLSRLPVTRSELDQSVVTELAWGVSNIVLRVDARRCSFVVKQSREQLRTKIDWFSNIERIWREVDVMHILAEVLPEGSVPRVLFEDRDNYLFGMEAVEADHRVWKAELLDGQFDVEIAGTLAGYLAAIHRDTTGISQQHPELSDGTNFDELRLDPFYRHMARTIPELEDTLTALIDETLSLRTCLVLADFSPKNILLTTRGPVLVDFETGHIGDPGFDIGFFLSHLLLKTVRHADRLDEIIQLPRRFWSKYASIRLPTEGEGMDSAFERRCVRHLGACMLSRVDGKSRVDYLTESWQPELVREFCHGLLLDEVNSILDAFARLTDLLNRPR